MLLKHVYMGWKLQGTLKLDISFSLEHLFISVAIFTQVASAPLICPEISCGEYMSCSAIYSNPDAISR